MGRYAIPPEKRFWSRVHKTHGGCWLWTGGKAAHGYGQFHDGVKQTRAHRFSWELHNGRTVPGGLLVCHTCDTPACVRHDHLFLGTHADNMRDAALKGRLHSSGPYRPRSAPQEFRCCCSSSLCRGNAPMPED